MFRTTSEENELLWKAAEALPRCTEVATILAAAQWSVEAIFVTGKGLPR